LAGLLAALVALGGCGAAGGASQPPPVPFRTATPVPSPTPRPTATPRPLATLEPTATAGASTSPTRAASAPTNTPAGAGAAPTPGATATANQPPRPLTFSGENAYRHVEELSIGIGVRAAGAEGEARAADFIADQFAALGYAVTRQPFSITTFLDNGSTLTIDVEPRQIQPLAMYYSGAGQIDGAVAIGGLGAPADFMNGVATGKIALVERGGGLTFQEKARNAKGGGAVGVIVFNNVEGPVQGSLTDPFDLPVVSISRTDGMRLKRLVEQRTVRASLKVNVVTEQKPSQNVLAASPGSSGRLPIIIVGSHYDTLPVGPGANNNASGVGVMLELARALAREQRAELRFVAFGAQEVGQVGSKTYVERLTSDEKGRLTAMINVDMIAVGPTLAFAGAEDLVTRALGIADRLQIPKVTRLTTQRTAVSDHVSFINAGLPAIFIHRPDDPNYNTAQDRAQFVKIDSLQSVGAVTLRLIEQLLERQAA
jgi:aminopeptidase YwaD